jgi:signal transduction histidine kinase
MQWNRISKLEKAMSADLPLEQIMSAILDATTDAVLIFDAEWRLRSINTQAQMAFPQANSAWVGHALKEIPIQGEIEAIMLAHQNGNDWQNASRKTFSPRVQPLGSASDLGWLILLRDISQSSLNRGQYEFIRVVSHDLRSPLTSIQGFAGMLSSAGTLNERQTYYVEKILSGITQMTALVENIQDAGRFDPETSFYEMSRTACDVGALVQRIVSSHLVPAEKQELTLNVHIDDALPIISADSLMLERAVTNLIDNAIKYTPNGGKIDVFVTPGEGSVVIAVQDTGYGIPLDDQKLLFQRHVRLTRKDQRKVRGSGLGLFIVKSVAQRHNGAAWVTSQEGQGSTFYLSIPIS